MGNQPEQKTIKRIQPIDINIILELYYFRVMSTQQIQERYNLTKSYVYLKIGILKNKDGIDRKDSIQGIFTNPNGEESIVYILRENTLKMTIAKMDGQIKKHSKIDESKRDRGIYERPTANYYIFVKGQQTYLDVL